MRNIFLIIFTFFISSVKAQTLINSIEISSDIEETSGLALVNNKLITHNDSGGKAELYEINPTTGNIDRTIQITNAINTDWEDIAVDNTHIYIGDIGNNNGNRRNLRIYKILIADFLAENSVTAELIEYSYANQESFESQPNNNNFDAEGLIAFENNLYLFSKNWTDATSNIYSLPKTPGTYAISPSETLNTNGLVTGADVRNNNLILSGYTQLGFPFVFTSTGFTDNSFTSGNLTRTSVSLPASRQIEGISFIDNNTYYLSSELDLFRNPSTLYTISLQTPLSTNNIQQNINSKTNRIDVNHIRIETKDTFPLVIYNLEGKTLLVSKTNSLINIQAFKNRPIVIRINNSKTTTHLF